MRALIANIASSARWQLWVGLFASLALLAIRSWVVVGWLCVIPLAVYLRGGA